MQCRKILLNPDLIELKLLLVKLGFQAYFSLQLRQSNVNSNIEI